MYYVILILLALVLLLLFRQALTRMNVHKLALSLRYGGAIIVFLAGAFLGVTGRYALAVPLFITGIALLRKSLPFSLGNAQKTASQNSTVRTSLVEMELDHDSGAMRGIILVGSFEGRTLDDLSIEEMAELYRSARALNDQSADLLESYLDREHPEWIDLEAFADIAGKARSKTSSSGPMTRAEAFEILGLTPKASTADIKKAHKNLMKKLHPDQGGSSYLATKLNEAKDVLLG